jgi:hypothetical protein
MGPRAGLNVVENRKFLTISGLELRSLGHPSGSQSLYRLRYKGDQYYDASQGCEGVV